MDNAEQFFYKNAGWSYQTGEETSEQGRARGVRVLAEAEAYAKAHGWYVDWSDDWGVDHQKEYDCYPDGGPTTCESAVLWNGDDLLEAVGCVDDATPEYRRVIEAELASDALDTIRRAEKALDPHGYLAANRRIQGVSL